MKNPFGYNEGADSTFLREFFALLMTIIAAVISAFSLHIFVYPSNFAPSGVDGIATMLQKLTGINAGLYSFIMNLPILIVAWFVLKKRFVIYTLIFTVISSILLFVLSEVGFYQYVTETDRWISASFSGALLGVRTGFMLRIGASSGGVDVIASMIQKKSAYINVERIISVLCYVIIGASYFVYWNIECIFLSIAQMILFEFALSRMLAPTRNAVEIKIVTKNPNEIRNEILFNLKHGATIVESKGLYTEEGSSIIFSVINNRQIPEFLNVIKKYPETFVYFNDVKGVRGNFRWFKNDVVK